MAGFVQLQAKSVETFQGGYIGFTQGIAEHAVKTPAKAIINARKPFRIMSPGIICLTVDMFLNDSGNRFIYPFI